MKRALSRRDLMQKLGAAAGVAALMPRYSSGPRPRRPRRCSGSVRRAWSPIRRAISRPAPAGNLSRSRHAHYRSGVQLAPARQHADPAAVDRRDVVRRPGVVEPGSVSGLERHPQQPADALAGRRRPRHGVQIAVEQQQRQHLRSSGAPTLLRARGTAAWCATSTTARSPSSPTRYKGKRLNSPNDIAVHPDGSIWFTDPPFGGSLYEGDGRCCGWSRKPARPAECKGRTAGRRRRAETRVAVQRLSCRSGRTHRHGRSANRISAAPGTALPSRRTTRSSTSSRAVEWSSADVGADNRISAPDNVQQLHGRWRPLRSRWYSRRRLRQPVVQQQRRATTSATAA